MRAARDKRDDAKDAYQAPRHDNTILDCGPKHSKYIFRVSAHHKWLAGCVFAGEDTAEETLLQDAGQFPAKPKQAVQQGLDTPATGSGCRQKRGVQRWDMWLEPRVSNM